MRRIVSRLSAALALALGLAAGSAQADVVYTWQPDDGPATIEEFGALRFDDGAFDAGPITAQAAGLGGSPARLLQLIAPGISFSGNFVSVLELAQAGDGLTGRIAALDINSDAELDMVAGGGLWTVTRYFNGLMDRSVDVAGRWVLVDAGQVPTPGVVPLMALASVGLGLSLRKRQAAQ